MRAFPVPEGMRLMYVNYSAVSPFCQSQTIRAAPLTHPRSICPAFTERLLQNPGQNGYLACRFCVTTNYTTGSDLEAPPARLDFATGGYELSTNMMLEAIDTFESREFYVKAEES